MNSVFLATKHTSSLTATQSCTVANVDVMYHWNNYYHQRHYLAVDRQIHWNQNAQSYNESISSVVYQQRLMRLSPQLQTHHVHPLTLKHICR